MSKHQPAEPVSSANDLFLNGFKGFQEKPPSTASRSLKKAYSEALSHRIASLFGESLRRRGLKEARPSEPGEVGTSGAERRMSGGLGAKKVDVTWATEESGLMIAMSIKTINFPSFQKNLTNRRGDMLYEAVTLHRRFPFAVLGGFLFFDYGATKDSTRARNDTITNAHSLLKIFTGRRDPAGREEQFEGLYVGLIDVNPFQVKVELWEAGKPDEPLTLQQVFDGLLSLVAERNPDFYDFRDGALLKAGKVKSKE